jgi:hypothetical protein
VAIFYGFMNMSNKNLFWLKKQTFHEADEHSVRIMDHSGQPLGKLVPVGPWVLVDISIISLLVSWRDKFKKMFPTQTSVDLMSTTKFLTHFFIDNDQAVLFLIYSESGQLLGHIGVSDLSECSFEVTNLMRGEPGGHPDLIYFSEYSVIDYMFEKFNLESASVEVMSYNWMVRSLHEDIGFKVIESKGLRKLVDDSGIRHEVVRDVDANVEYTIQKMLISRKSFDDNGNSYDLH